jgi:hypothetical protein
MVDFLADIRASRQAGRQRSVQPLYTVHTAWTEDVPR